MKKILFLLFAALFAVACDPYDDSEILSQFEKDALLHEQQQKDIEANATAIAALRAEFDDFVKTYSDQANLIADIQNDLKGKLYITSVDEDHTSTPWTVTIKLSNDKTYVIRDGLKGEAGDISYNVALRVGTLYDISKLDITAEEKKLFNNDQLYWIINDKPLTYNGSPVAINMESYTPTIVEDKDGVLCWALKGKILYNGEYRITVQAQISIVKEDGIYYWASNGKILEADGKKIVASPSISVDKTGTIVVNNPDGTVEKTENFLNGYVLDPSNQIVRLIGNTEISTTFAVGDQKYTLYKSLPRIIFSDTKPYLGIYDPLTLTYKNGQILFSINIGPDIDSDRIVLNLASQQGKTKINTVLFNEGPLLNYNENGTYAYEYNKKTLSSTYKERPSKIDVIVSFDLVDPVVGSKHYLTFEVFSTNLPSSHNLSFEFTAPEVRK
jgi:hypothetical protein